MAWLQALVPTLGSWQLVTHRGSEHHAHSHAATATHTHTHTQPHVRPLLRSDTSVVNPSKHTPQPHTRVVAAQVTRLLLRWKVGDGQVVGERGSIPQLHHPLFIPCEHPHDLVALRVPVRVHIHGGDGNRPSVLDWIRLQGSRRGAWDFMLHQPEVHVMSRAAHRLHCTHHAQKYRVTYRSVRAGAEVSEAEHAATNPQTGSRGPE